MTTYVPPKKNTALIMYVALPSYATSGIMQTNPTLAAGDAKISIDGGALTNLTTLPAVTPASSKMVAISLSASEMNGDNIAIVLSDQTNPPEWVDVIVNIQTTARQIDDLAFPNTSGRGIDVDATGGVEVGSFATGAIDAAALAADAGTEIGTAVWATTTRQLTALDEDVTTLDLDATIRAAVGLASANLDTQIADLPTNAELATSQAAADDATLAAIAALSIPTAAAVADAVWDEDATAHQTQGTFGQAIGDPAADADTIWGLVNTNLNATVSSRASQTSLDTVDDLLDTEISALTTAVADIPTNAELATALGTADDAVLAAIAALTIPSAAVVADAVWDEAIAGHLTAGSTGAALNTASAAGSAPTASAIADEVETRILDVNIVQVNEIPINGSGTEEVPWGPT